MSAITASGAEPIPRLLQFVIHADGATVTCHYCNAETAITAGDVAEQIHRFQESHFGCDPVLAVNAAIPRQLPPATDAVH